MTQSNSWNLQRLQHTHTCLMGLFPGLPRWASTRKAKRIWILLKQETVSGSGISWAICKSAPRSRQITMPCSTPPLSFLQAGCPSCRPTNSVKALKATNLSLNPEKMWHMTSVDTITQWREDRSSASVVNHTIVTDPTIRQPSFDLPHHTWSPMNHFQTGQGPHIVLTCTNGVSLNHLPMIVASDRPRTTLSTRAH